MHVIKSIKKVSSQWSSWSSWELCSQKGTRGFCQCRYRKCVKPKSATYVNGCFGVDFEVSAVYKSY